MKYSPKAMNELLEKNGFNLKKKFGQNFIIDENIITAIVEKSEVDKNTIVLEIGPGAGALTYKLAEHSKQVIAYEVDKSLEPILSETLRDKENIEVIYEDFLEANMSSIIGKYKEEKIFVVANLPYYITTPILIKIIEDKLPIEKIVVMVQKEVGNRLKAKPNSKDYSSLSIYIDYYYEVSKVMDISKNVFVPKPNVDSIIVSFKKREEKIYIRNEGLFFKLVRDSFKQKRKTLKNNLTGYNLNVIEETLQKHNLNLTTRAEAISTAIFAEIANALEASNDK